MDRLMLAVAVSVAAGAGAAAGWIAAERRMPVAAPETRPTAPRTLDGVVQDESGRRVLYWHDPMFPQSRFDRPGKSPFMDMQLVPVYADAGAGEGGVSVSPVMSQSLGIRVVPAERGTLDMRIEAVGGVGWNERGVVVLQARAAGFVSRLHVRAPLDAVARNAPLVDLLLPEWAAAQQEYLLLSRRAGADAARLADAARARLRLLGMTGDEIDELERSGSAHGRVTLRSPLAGVVAELGVREGMTVMAGTTLFRLVDTATVWITAEVPEAQAALLAPGAAAEVRLPAWPGRVWKGRVAQILPEANTTARTVRARVELANPDGLLRPGMFADLSLAAAAVRAGVLVPSEALIRTGERDVVITRRDGRFHAVEVRAGREAGGRTEILRGIEPGDQVVASGQFLIDSEASLKSALARLTSAPSASPSAGGRAHDGVGRVIALDAARGFIELDHEPMPSLGWPRMTMGFRLADPKALAGITPGDRVEFSLRPGPDANGDYMIERLRRGGAKR